MSTTPIKVAAAASKGGLSFVARGQYPNAFEIRRTKHTTEESRDQEHGHKVLRVAVKANLALDTTTCGSNLLQKYESPLEATAIRHLQRNKNVTMVGKTRMDEFGMGSHSTNTQGVPVCNVAPYSERSAGGSSGGSAVAVASDQCDVALGTDTGGSVRLPAAYTGVIGFKPSYGRISRYGLVPYANSLDTVGIFCKDINLLRQSFLQLDGADPKDTTCASEKSRQRFDSLLKDAEILRDAGAGEPFYPVHSEGMKTMKAAVSEAKVEATEPSRIRIGIPTEYNIKELTVDVRQTWKVLMAVLQRQNYELVPISLPSTKHALSAYYVLAAAEAASNLAKYDGIRYGSRPFTTDAGGDVLFSQTRGWGFGEEVKRRILLGSYTLSSEAIDNHFIQAQRVRRLVQRDFDRVFLQQNPLHPKEQFDLSEIDEEVTLENKLGPTQVDFILCPTAPTRPPLITSVKKQAPVDTYMNDVFTVPASLAGLPAISIPVNIPEYFRGNNVPWVGMQLIGQYWNDTRVIRTASDILKLWNQHENMNPGSYHKLSTCDVTKDPSIKPSSSSKKRTYDNPTVGPPRRGSF